MVQINASTANLFPGYTIHSSIYESPKSLIFRATREQDGASVIIKQLKQEFATAKEVSRFRLEYQLINKLSLDGVIRVHEYKTHKDRHALVLEDFGAESLEKYLSEDGRAPQSTADLLRFVEYGIQLADTLARVHQHNIIHKDIKPHNIVINRDAGVVKVIDFGIASLISRETPEITSPDLLEGSLAYISPEQTGRMNRHVDYRSDLYSLGVTFYQMLTGVLPFDSNDSIELVHCHLAKIPIPPASRNPTVPAPLSDVVMKLLSKSPEDRYQGGYGLKQDLQHCLDELRATGTITPFRLAAHDISGSFSPKMKLYGREAQTALLMEYFARVSSGAMQNALVLVGGYSGIGKSSLINELHRPLTECRGYFISGKFDQFKRNIPYASFIQAFQGMIRQLLVESDEKLAYWRRQLLRALGNNGKVIVDVIPEVESIIGPQPPVPELGAVENQNRFNKVFRDFCNVFCQKEHPLVIFLDDLQWADAPTLGLLELIITDPDIRYLLFIGAYRDNEVDAKHLLTKTLNDIGKERSIETITLKPLAFEHVNELVADSLLCDASSARLLTERVYDKTQGNPFFAKMFLNAIYQEGFLQFDLDKGRWVFDLDKIDAMGITENVVDLMVGRLRKLPADTQAVLALAAGIGNQFNLRILSLVYEHSVEQAAAPLWPALEQGLLVPIGDEYKWVEHQGDPNARFRFLHDRVQQAAYVLTPEAERASLHLRLGRLLLQHLTAEEYAEHMFEVVDHLNRGGHLITEVVERERVAQLNLTAARRAKMSSAYVPALSYVLSGLKYLGEEAWSKHYQLAYDLYLEKGELEYLIAQWDTSIATFNHMLDNASSLLDRARINALIMVCYRMKNDLKTAINMGVKALAEFGVEIKAFPTAEELDAELRRGFEFLTAGKDVESYFDLPEMDDPHKLAILSLLTECFTPAYFLGSRLLPIVGIRMSEICVKHGNCKLAPLSYMFYSSITLAFTSRDYANARRFGLLSLRLNDEKYHVKSSEAVILNMWGCLRLSLHRGDQQGARAPDDRLLQRHRERRLPVVRLLRHQLPVHGLLGGDADRRRQGEDPRDPARPRARRSEHGAVLLRHQGRHQEPGRGGPRPLRAVGGGVAEQQGDPGQVPRRPGPLDPVRRGDLQDVAGQLVRRQRQGTGVRRDRRALRGRRTGHLPQPVLPPAPCPRLRARLRRCDAGEAGRVPGEDRADAGAVREVGPQLPDHLRAPAVAHRGGGGTGEWRHPPGPGAVRQGDRVGRPERLPGERGAGERAGRQALPAAGPAQGGQGLSHRRARSVPPLGGQGQGQGDAPALRRAPGRRRSGAPARGQPERSQGDHDRPGQEDRDVREHDQHARSEHGGEGLPGGLLRDRAQPAAREADEDHDGERRRPVGHPGARPRWRAVHRRARLGRARRDRRRPLHPGDE
jgi:predicted ATPase/tRNA A-37 threonylcarbamoyl transferase component Bud32